MAVIELKIGCVDLSEKSLSLGTWCSKDESCHGECQREDAQGEMGGGGDAMETRAGLGRIWAVCAAC